MLPNLNTVRGQLEIKGVLEPVTLKDGDLEVTFYYGGFGSNSGPFLETRKNDVFSYGGSIRKPLLLLIPETIKKYLAKKCKEEVSTSWGKNTVSIRKQSNETILLFNNMYGCGCGCKTLRLIGLCAERFIKINLKPKTI